MLKLIIATVFLFAIGCASSPDRSREQDRQTVQSELSEEMSLKADRENLEDLRKEIPEDTRRDNDELALYLQLMKQGTEQPQTVRDRFQVMVQKRRTVFRDKVRRLRENYRRDETKRREDFLKAQKAKRDAYQARKGDSKANREFYSQQDKDRQHFSADERDRRQNFESEINAQSKDFESYMREKTNEFNEQYRLYSKKFSERPKEKKAVTGETGDFRRLDDVPAEPLGTDN